ncbi:P-loop containing nucleoside triphosphate hydrolase protein [Gigaspora rosea]|uniref:Origin recognition complex subunit 1 n=1 Tax=Gigaspora rosea TaxID=44941 RepID=A0A397W8S7_9GLOM|nr:P-loop containing nucleoside triphosphate hydrolase protein [Gigaspora rosea]
MCNRVKSVPAFTPLELRAAPTVKPETCYDKARAMLQLEEVPDYLPCREKEYKQIYDKVKSAIEEFSGHRIFISGQPGTGKTATVRQVVKNLQRKVMQKELHPFEFVEINGMEMKPPEKAYSALWEALTGDCIAVKTAEDLLNKTFNELSQRNPIVLMIDEFDVMVTKTNRVIYNFLEWTTLQDSYLIVIALTNRIDLPVTMLSARSESRIGLDRLTFAPYTHTELFTIVKSRLEGIELFENNAIEFAARKVSSISQDARNALCICRSAIGILESLAKTNDEINNKVTIDIVKEAIKKTNTPWSKYIRKCSFRAKMFLCTLLLLRRDGNLEIELKDIIGKYTKLCRKKGIQASTCTELSNIAYDLASSSIVSMDPSKDIYAQIKFNGNEEDVNMVLSDDIFFRDLVK